MSADDLLIRYPWKTRKLEEDSHLTYLRVFLLQEKSFLVFSATVTIYSLILRIAK